MSPSHAIHDVKPFSPFFQIWLLIFLSLPLSLYHAHTIYNSRCSFPFSESLCFYRNRAVWVCAWPWLLQQQLSLCHWVCSSLPQGLSSISSRYRSFISAFESIDILVSLCLTFLLYFFFQVVSDSLFDSSYFGFDFWAWLSFFFPCLLNFVSGACSKLDGFAVCSNFIRIQVLVCDFPSGFAVYAF